MEVLLAVAQEDMIEAHVETLYTAGLDPAALDVEPLAACRSLIDTEKDQGSYTRTYALLNIGANTTDLSIFRQGGLLSFTRPIPLAGDNITNAIAEALGYEFHEAERAKLENGTVYLQGVPALEAPRDVAPAGPPEIPPERPAPPVEDAGEAKVFDLGADTVPTERPPSEEPSAPPLPAIHKPVAGSPARQVYDAMLPTLVEMVTEIRRSIEYYVNRYPDSRVERIVLYGGTARLPNFAEFVANEVGTATEVANPFLRLTVDQASVTDEITKDNACYMPIVVGLAVRDMLE